MIKSELLQDKGILIVSPESPLDASDFKSLVGEIDPYIAQIIVRVLPIHLYLTECVAWPANDPIVNATS